MIWALIQYVLKAAYYDKLPLIFLITMLVSLSGAVFMGGTAITEQDQFVLVFASNSLRLLSVFITIFYITHYFSRSFQTQEISALLTKPFSRLQYLLAHYFAFQIIAFLFIVVTCLVFVLFFQSSWAYFTFWAVGLWCELSLVSLISLFFAILIPQSFIAAIASVGLYVLGRLSGNLLIIIETSQNQNILTLAGEYVVQFITMFVPRFDLFTQSVWLIYEQGAISFPYFLLFHFFVFTGLILSVTFFDLSRKEF